jgi:quercetin dioxygenase-like cupin family protein
VVLGGAVSGLDELVAARPLAAGDQIRTDRLERTDDASYHLVQVAGREQPHRHVAHDLVVFVLRGRGTLTLEDAAVTLVAGDAALVPRGAAHWFANGGAEPAVALVVFTPPLDAPDTVPVDSRGTGG